MKKPLCLVLCAGLTVSLALGLLTGCGEQGTAQTPAPVPSQAVSEDGASSAVPDGTLYRAGQAKENTFSKGLNALTAGMPAVSAQEVPNWHGTSLEPRVIWDNLGRRITEADIAGYADMELNYIRLSVRWTDIAEIREGAPAFDPEALEDLDHVVEWCAQYQIHVNLCPHGLSDRGFIADTISGEDDRRAFVLQVWDVLSARYADVPSCLMSYGLVSESDGGAFTDGEYTAAVLEEIETIRANDKTGKLLVYDGIPDGSAETGWGWANACLVRPADALPAGIMQTLQIFPWDDESKSGYISLQDWPYQWAQAVSGDYGGGNCLVLTGDFPAGTIVRLQLEAVYELDGGDIVCTADGVEVVSYSRSFTVGEGNCVSIEDNTARFNVSTANGYCIEFPIEHACSRITIGPDFRATDLFVAIPSNTQRDYLKPDSAEGEGFVYRTGAYDTVYICMTDAGSDTPSVIHINADCSYTVDNPADVDVFDLETLRAYVERWAQWSAETGTPIMCSGFGVPIGLPEDARTGYLRSVLELFEEYDIPWCLYTNGWADWSPVVNDGLCVLPMDGSLTQVGDQWYDEPVLALLKEFASKE